MKQFLFLSCLAALSGVTVAADGTYLPITAPRENLWSELSKAEISDLRKFLRANNILNNETLFEAAYYSSSLPPNKTDAVSYLDGSGPKPDRYARASVQYFSAHSNWRIAYEQEYMVGPFPISDQTTVTNLTYPYRNGGRTKPAGPLSGLRSESGPEKRAAPNGQYRPHQHSDYEMPVEDRVDSGTDAEAQPGPLVGPGVRAQWNGEQMPHDNVAPPMPIQPSGPRYSVDPDQWYVEWMDFSFYASWSLTGLGLHDIRFKGKRIIYELTLQECLAQYGGETEGKMLTSYFDAWGGLSKTKLVPGYDCPEYATFFPGLCLFEFQKDYPIQRHSEYGVTITKNIAFIARSVSTIGNYDYMFTYEFYLDGSIQVIARASGYIEADTWRANKPDVAEYGYHIRDHISGGLHDHILNYKLDLDVNGEANTLMRTRVVPHAAVYPWTHGKEFNTMKIDRSYITNEDAGRINWDANAAAVYSVVNKDTPNQWGEYPGFKIFPSTGSSIRMTNKNATDVGVAAQWANYPLFVLKRKDTEPWSTANLNQDNVWDPLVNFDEFFDGESIEQEDITLYFNLGMHHVPDTYDLPQTVFTGSSSGITIRPSNYLTEDASRSTRNMVKIIPSNNGDAKVNYFGAEIPEGNFDLSSAEPDLEKYFGKGGGPQS